MWTTWVDITLQVNKTKNLLGWAKKSALIKTGLKAGNEYFMCFGLIIKTVFKVLPYPFSDTLWSSEYQSYETHAQLTTVLMT